jgi:endo-1,3-1,4-beta-glycanase ExoK
MFKNTFYFMLLSIFLFGCGEESSFNQETTAEEFRTLLLDDFTENNQTLWQKADWANGDPFYSAWCPEQIDFNESLLTITLEQKDCHAYTHASGEYRTLNTYKYGKYTAKFQASDVNGTISSLFVYTGVSEGTEWDEIDIEILGKDTTKVQFNYWRNGHEHPILFDLGFDASLATHTYSFVWHQDYIKWYVDDQLIHTVTQNNNSDNDSLPINAGKIIINLWAATGIDSWSGTYIDNSTAKAYYDYVKYEEFR